MKERRYSVSEIDRMRSSIHAAENSNSYWPQNYDRDAFYGGWSSSTNWAAQAAAQSARVEDQLRTYMIGGASPIELEKKAADADLACKKRIELYEIEKTERLLKKEYGPHP